MVQREEYRQKKLLRQLQGDLPVLQKPFLAMAIRAGMSEKAALDTIESLLQQGVIRKIGAILRHQQAGITRNAMVIWAVPAERADETGAVFSSFREITHCYERRPPFRGRYNLFTMIHAGEGKLEGVIAKISRQTGISDYKVLLSEEEFKKSSMEYF